MKLLADLRDAWFMWTSDSPRLDKKSLILEIFLIP